MATRQEDGARRRDRTRTAIVGAACELIEETWMLPSADAVAERAGISRRSVFHHFSDRHELALAIIADQENRMAADLPPLLTDGPFEPRLAAFVERRVRLLERLFPYRRAAQALEVEDAILAERQTTLWQLNQAEIAAAFREELSSLGSQRGDVLLAAQAASSWLAWDALRRLGGVDAKRSARIMTRVLAAILVP